MSDDRTLDRIAAMEGLMRSRAMLEGIERNLEAAKAEAARFRTAGIWIVDNCESIPSGVLGTLGDAVMFQGKLADGLAAIMEAELPIARAMVQEREADVAFLGDDE